MKRGIVICLLFTLSLSAESKLETKVDIKKIVKQQIESAKKKEWKVEKSSTVKVDEKMVEQPKQAEAKSFEQSAIIELEKIYFEGLKFYRRNPDVIKYAFFGFASFLILIYVALRRIKMNKKPQPQNNFKTNIKLVREEKFIKPIDPDLKKIRTNLCLTSKYLNTSEHYVTETARRYNLAKTEVLLAQRFRKQSVVSS